MWPAALLLCAALSACGGGDPGDAAQADALEAEAASSGGAAHALRLAAGAGEAGKGKAQLSYYGGRVLESAEAVVVLWGSQVPEEVASGMGPFYAALLRKSAVAWLAEYDTTVDAVDGKPGTGQSIGAGSLKGVFTITPKARGSALTDAAIRKELTSQITARKLPAPGASTVYLVHLPPGVTVDLDGSHSCASGGFCAYHNSFKRSSKEVDYAVLPDLGPGSGCETGCGTGATQFDNQTAVASHELTEAITDPAVGLARGLGRPLAWYSEQGGEIGDLCNGQQARFHAGTGKVYTVQKEWSNKARACVFGGSGASDLWE